ncbi:MAG: GNAT family N-acetyltransferase [Planctomycetota bacterium]
MAEAAPGTAFHIRELQEGDLERVIEIDALHTGEAKRSYWGRVFREFLAGGEGPARVALAAEHGGRMVGYILGEVRAFEFGSEACGWIFAAGVDPERLRAGIASGLLEAACRSFQEAGIRDVRTMVRRNNVPVLSFFRANGFVGGSFVQLERGV